MDTVRIILAEDDARIQEAFRHIADEEPCLDLLGVACDGEQAVQMTLQFEPQVVLMDIQMPRMNGIEATRRIKRALPPVQVVIWTIFADDQHVFEAIKAGAIGYLLKDSPTQEIIEGILAAARGESLLHPAVASRVIQEFQRLRAVPQASPEWLYELTARETEVLRLLAQTRRLSLPEEVTDLAHQFGLDLSRPFGTYTPGQRKILFLIHAFVFPADVLILDEPTAGLETTAQDVVYRLARQARAEGRTVFFTTSSLLEAERLCDRVALLWQGRVLAVERGVQLRAKTLRRIEMRFATPVTCEAFAGLPNLEELHLEDNKLRCTLRGDPDAFLKIASQYRITDFISQQPGLDEIYRRYYGVSGYAA
jgi:DNA-binding NarL/FixJ family response regulator